MGQLVGAIEGDRRGRARARLSDRVGQRVALQRDDGRRAFPRPLRSAASDSSPTWRRRRRPAFKAEGQDILLVGGAPGWLGRSAWLATVAGREEGAPPPVDLAAERRNGEFVASLIAEGRVTAVQDLSDGGLAVALAEMAMAGGIGASVEASRPGARVLLRRGPGPLCADRRAGRDGAHPRSRPGGDGVPVARIGVTGGASAEARHGAAGRPCGAARGARILAAGLSWTGPPHDPLRHRQDQGRLRLFAGPNGSSPSARPIPPMRGPHDRRRNDRRDGSPPRTSSPGSRRRRARRTRRHPIRSTDPNGHVPNRD